MLELKASSKACASDMPFVVVGSPGGYTISLISMLPFVWNVQGPRSTVVSCSKAFLSSPYPNLNKGVIELKIMEGMWMGWVSHGRGGAAVLGVG